MRTKLLILVAVVFTASVAMAQTTISGSIITGGLTRTYRVYIPAIYNSANPVPLVFNFHGYGGTNVQQEVYGDFRPIADTANFIVVHPMGSTYNGSQTGWNNFYTVDLAQPDLNFISNLIDTLKTQYNIDLNRVYSTGMSNGGFMSYDIACFLSTRFAAIASVTGSMIEPHLSACNPTHPLPVMQIHGTADATVTYNGVGGIVPSAQLHIDSLVKHWVIYNQCNAIPTFTALPDINTTDNCTAEHYVYEGGTSGSTVEFYKIINGGHTWPRSVYSAIGVNTNKDFSASKEIWRFFRKYSLNSLVDIKENTSSDLDFLVYPNPSTGIFNIKYNYNQPITIKIINQLGETVFENKLSQNNNSINLNNIPKGIYFYQAQNSLKIVKSGKLVIQ